VKNFSLPEYKKLREIFDVLTLLRDLFVVVRGIPEKI